MHVFSDAEVATQHPMFAVGEPLNHFEKQAFLNLMHWASEADKGLLLDNDLQLARMAGVDISSWASGIGEKIRTHLFPDRHNPGYVYSPAERVARAARECAEVGPIIDANGEGAFPV